MSVAHLTIRELSTFVAIASARCQAGTVSELAEMAEMMSRSNSAAFHSQYGDYAVPATASEIEAEALRMLAHDELPEHFGPLVYNCVTNDGVFYYGDLPADATQTQIQHDVARWRKLEDDAHKWLEGHARQLKRAEENAVAFDQVPRLPMKTRDELKALMGDGALIIATFRVNESDSMTDYYGGRTARSVVIGVRKSKRESFPSLRKAAAAFPPTADYGPGKSRWHASTYREAPPTDGRYRERLSLRDDHYRQAEFSTLAEAEAYVANLIATSDECRPDYVGVIGFAALAQAYGVEYHEDSIEHRENYSMGGGNYLGRSRYGGWVVKSTTYVSEAMECWKL